MDGKTQTQKAATVRPQTDPRGGTAVPAVKDTKADATQYQKAASQNAAAAALPKSSPILQTSNRRDVHEVVDDSAIAAADEGNPLTNTLALENDRKHLGEARRDDYLRAHGGTGALAHFKNQPAQGGYSAKAMDALNVAKPSSGENNKTNENAFEH